MRLKNVKATGMGRFFTLSRQFPNCINLSLGEPDFPVPEGAFNAGLKAAAGGRIGYEPTNGIAALRKALVDRIFREHKLEYDPESEVLVTVGATEAVSIALLALVNPGDEVLVPDPGFVTYEPCVAISDGRPVSIPLFEKNGFCPCPSDVTSLLTPKSRVMLLNFPNNPTGSILSYKEVRELAKITRERDLLVISDEVHEKIIYDGTKHECIAALPGMRERTLVIGSFSKTYAMTGLRVGYVFGPKDLIAPLWKLHQYMVACVDSIAQQVALAALVGSQEPVREMVEEFGRRRDLVFSRLNEIDGITCVRPKGAFYAFPNIAAFNMSSEQFSEYLLREAHVITVPGSLFGALSEGYVRLSYTADYSRLEEAFARIEKTVSRLKHD